MFKPKKNFRPKIIIIITFFLLSIGQAFADISNCRPFFNNENIDMFIGFDITSNTENIIPGKILAEVGSSIVGIGCIMTGEQNKMYFKITMPDTIKDMLINNGVEIYQRYTIGPHESINITLPDVTDIDLGYWNTSKVDPITNLAFRYNFIVKKGTSVLKPFDTGVFLLGHHVNEDRVNIGAPIYARFVGNLTLLCPTPKVNIIASNGGSVNFDNLTPQELLTGGSAIKNFNINISLQPDCETGLNISVRFEPNNNTVLDNKNLDMGNGLQMLISDKNGDVNYNENYFVGELNPATPITLPYNAALSHIPNRNIVSGPFSKTIRVVVSY